MATKKTFNSGRLSIRPCKNDTYSIRVLMQPDDEHDKRWYAPSRKVTANSKSEAVALGLAYQEELDRARATNTDLNVTLGTYARQWHESRSAQGKVQALTTKRDETEIRRIEKYLGNVKVREVTTDVLDRAYTKMAADDITQSSRAKVHGKLRQIMRQAVASGLLSRNPCDGIQGLSRPKVTEDKRDEQRVDQDDLARLFTILRSEPQEGKTVALWLGAATGMRRGEVLALTWREVDLAKGIITVRYQLGKEGIRKAPKTGSSKRIVAICALDDVDADPTIAYLKEWHKRQRVVFEDYRNALDKKGDTKTKRPQQSLDTPVCSNARCSWQGVDNFGRWRRNWYVKHDFGYYDHEEPYVDAAGIKRIRRTGYHGPTFHSLRHTQATVLIGEGADVKAVQDRLGHAQASTTLNIYAEAQKSKERATASMMSQVIRNNMS